MLQIKQATLVSLDELISLFVEYRQFYQMPANEETSRQFLTQRLQSSDSLILLAYQQRQIAGFTQIYPVFSSVAMRPVWLLNDLFVTKRFRQNGIASGLIDEVVVRAKQQAIFSIKLATAIDNHAAKNLYLKKQFQQVQNFEHYSLVL